MRELVSLAIAGVVSGYLIRQCRKPSGWAGRFFLASMNRSHAGLTAWGLQHAKVGARDRVLDIGCGGGRTIQRLAEMATEGQVHGVDLSEASVAASRTFNRAAVESGHVQIQQASVSKLPLEDNTLELVTAVETHYYWPDRHKDLREVLRVLKPGGELLIVAEAYRRQRFDWPNRLAMKLIGGAFLSADEHRELFSEAGYREVQIFEERRKGWICATGRKPV